MNKKRVLETAILSLGYVLLFLTVQHKLGDRFETWATWTILLGAAILYFHEQIADKIKNNLVSKLIIRTLGIILLFLGFKTFLRQYVEVYWVLFIVAGALIYNYYHLIAARIMGEQNNG